MIVQIKFTPHIDVDSWKIAEDHSVLISNLNHDDAKKQKELLDLLLSKKLTPNEFEEAQQQWDKEFYEKLNNIVKAK